MTNKISFRFLSASVAAVGAALALSPAAFAGSNNTAASGSVSVNSDVKANCIAQVSGSVSLTGYDSVVANASGGVDKSDSSTASIKYTCTRGLPVSIELGYGSNAAGDGGTQRYLKNGSETIAYNLLDVATPWGDVAHNAAKSVTGTGLEVSAPITVVIPKGQNPSFANGTGYTDTITANMNY
jgi:spore coat protein U-like protein